MLRINYNEKMLINMAIIPLMYIPVIIIRVHLTIAQVLKASLFCDIAELLIFGVLAAMVLL